MRAFLKAVNNYEINSKIHASSAHITDAVDYQSIRQAIARLLNIPDNTHNKEITVNMPSSKGF